MPRVTVTIITLNEAAHIADAIDSAAWADEIIVVDSGSVDDTLAIARAKGARTETRAWTGYVDQKNFAAEPRQQRLDLFARRRRANPAALASEIRSAAVYRAATRRVSSPRVTHHLGRWVRTTDFYPDYQTRLYDRRRAQMAGPLRARVGHGRGSVGSADEGTGALLVSKPERSPRSHQRLHHAGGAADARERPPRHMRCDLLFHPPAAFLRNYILRRGFLDGTAGLTLSIVNAYSVFLKFAKLWELQRCSRST